MTRARRLQTSSRIPRAATPTTSWLVDAHLDAIYGAGMLDNGSGSATILDIAQKMKNVKPAKQAAVHWFGGEELGLLGSTFYVNNLSPTELGPDPIRPGCGRHRDAELHHRRPRPGGRRPLRPDGHADIPAAGVRAVAGRPRPDDQVLRLDREAARDVFARGHGRFELQQSGIPASGVLTGQDCCKSQDE